jgi:hypothetical protein
VRDLAVSELHGVGCADLAAAMATASTTAELAAVAEQATVKAPPLAATFAGYASDCVGNIGKGYYAMCGYVAATAFGSWSTVQGQGALEKVSHQLDARARNALSSPARRAATRLDASIAPLTPSTKDNEINAPWRRCGRRGREKPRLVASNAGKPPIP